MDFERTVARLSEKHKDRLSTLSGRPRPSILAIRELIGVGIFSPEDAHTIEELRRLRNEVVHGMVDYHVAVTREIVEDLEINFKTAALWLGRFRKEGVNCLWEVASGRGRKPTYPCEKVEAIIESTLRSKPSGATHWSCRTMAKEHGVSKATVNRIWQSHQLKPHRTDSFKLSRDPHFLEKLTDVVGLYLNPPAKALVLCVDEEPNTGIGPHSTRIAA